MVRPIGIRFREASTKVHHPPSPFASQPPQLGPSLPTPRNPSPPHPSGSLERPNASPSLSLVMLPRAACSRLRVRVRADVHAASLLRVFMSGDCAARCRRTPLPWPCPARPGAVAAPTALRRAPRVLPMPVPCGCHCHLRCLQCAQRHRRPHVAGVTACDPPGSCAALGWGLPSPPAPAAALRAARHRRRALPKGAGRAARAARRRCRCAPAPLLRPLLHCSLPPPPRRACPRPAHRWPARTSPATVPHPRARGHRHLAARRSCCLCRIWGRVAATPPCLRVCTAARRLIPPLPPQLPPPVLSVVNRLLELLLLPFPACMQVIMRRLATDRDASRQSPSLPLRRGVHVQCPPPIS